METLKKTSSILIVLIVLLGVSALILQNVDFSEMRAEATTFSEKSTEVAKTQLAESMQQTLSVTPTITITTTPVPSPTPFTTFCNSQVAENTRAFRFPSRGYSDGSLRLSVGEEVKIFGTIGERGWWPILVKDAQMWVRRDAIVIDKDCIDSLPEFSISEIIGNRAINHFIVEDTFFGSYVWKDESGNRISSRKQEPFSDYYLPIFASLDETTVAILSADTFDFRKDLIVDLSVSNRFLSGDSFFSIRILDDENSQYYYEVRVRGDCSIEVVFSNPSGEIQSEANIPLDSESNDTRCNDSIEDLIEIRLQGNRLTGSVNGLSLPIISLDNMQNFGSEFKVGVSVSGSASRLYFIAVVQTK